MKLKKIVSDENKIIISKIRHKSDMFTNRMNSIIGYMDSEVDHKNPQEFFDVDIITKN